MWLLYQFVKRFSKKVLYFLTVKDAVDTLSHYWHRAFLLDYMIRAGHLQEQTAATYAAAALSETLAEVRESPPSALARQVVRQTHHVLRLLLSMLRRPYAAGSLQAERAVIGAGWGFSPYLEGVAAHYQAAYQRLWVEASGKSESE